MSDMIKNLNDEEKKVFVETLMRLIKIDGIVDDNEKKFLKEIITIYGVDATIMLQADLDENKLLLALRQNITSRTKALFLIKELLTVANIDDDLVDAEVDFIEKVAQVLNIEQQKILQINQLVLNRKLWLQQYAMIMEDVA